jgi:hypothetical protein
MTFLAQGRAPQSADIPVEHFETFSFFPMDRQTIDDLLQAGRDLLDGYPVYTSFPVTIEGGIRAYSPTRDLLGHFSAEREVRPGGQSIVRLVVARSVTPLHGIDVDFRNHIAHDVKWRNKFSDGQREKVSVFLECMDAYREALSRSHDACTPDPSGRGAPNTGASGPLAMFRIEYGGPVLGLGTRRAHVDGQAGRKTVVSNIPVKCHPAPFPEQLRGNGPSFFKNRLRLGHAVSPRPFEVAAFDGERTIHRAPNFGKRFRESIQMHQVPAR